MHRPRSRRSERSSRRSSCRTSAAVLEARGRPAPGALGPASNPRAEGIVLGGGGGGGRPDASKYSLESSRRDLHNALLCTALESNPQKPGKTWKEKSLAKTTSGRDDQKKPVAAASYSILQRDEWLRRKKPRGKKFQSNSVVFCCCCSVSVALYSGEGSQPT